MRKLASIQRIKNIQPIKDCDNIELVGLLGWHVVSRKGEFKVNDLCLYLEVDSFIPIKDNIYKEQFEFLRKSSYRKLEDGTEGFRLRTCKFRGQISQGLVLPLKDFLFKKEPEEGEDVSGILGVTKFEPPIPACLSGEVIGYFPSYISKTDETRIQAVPEVLERHRGKRFIGTEKLDGTSCTIFNNNGEFGVCGRTLNLKENIDNTYWKMAYKYDLKSKLPLKGNYAIQGEITT